MPAVLVVVPCYNEERRLLKEKFLEFASRYELFQFLFVNDGSRDKTSEILEGIRQLEPNKFQVLRLEKNGGKAEAIRLGFLKGFESKPDYLAYWDADLATPLEALPLFIETFLQRPQTEIVMGSRVKLMGRNIERRMHRHYLGRIFATAASILLKLAVYDTQCGAKMFRRTETLKKIFEEPFHSRWIFDVELLARFIQSNRYLNAPAVEKLIVEYPLPEWRDIRGSKVRPLDFFTAFGELMQIFCRYPPR